MAGSNFGNLFGSGDSSLSADYKSAGSHQNEVFYYDAIGNFGNWETFHTLTADKIFYCSTILFTAPGAGASKIGINNAEILEIYHNAAGTIIVNMPTPIKFAGGTILQIKGAINAATITLIGWEE